ncbi:MAG: acetolactate synthase small subunit [Candidatus Firestonebacteria bacterium]|nr:acetolactate synthase small subunit [Candidatus Firestonebacteria bacterium]
MRHTLSVLVENKPGVLARVAGLFSGRGFNITSLTVGETEDPTVSRMTIVVTGDDSILEQVSKQLNKLIDTIKVFDITAEAHVEHELVLIKVQAEAGARAEITQLAEIFRAKIVDVSEKAFILEITGSADKVSAFIDLMRTFGIKELVRTGPVALTREAKRKK